MRSKPGLFLLAVCCLCIACNNDPGTPASTQSAAIPVINYSVTAYLPHDTALFTEGFLVHNGQIFESTGSPEEFPDAESVVGVINPHTGKMDQKIRLDKEKKK